MASADETIKPNQPLTMSLHYPKLELTWIGKAQRPRLEPRILLEDPEKSYYTRRRRNDHDQFDNRLIFGDNLLVRLCTFSN